MALAAEYTQAQQDAMARSSVAFWLGEVHTETKNGPIVRASEKAVIGSCFYLSSEDIEILDTVLLPEDFALPEMKALYIVLLAQARKDQPCDDLIAVHEAMLEAGYAPKYNGMDWHQIYFLCANNYVINPGNALWHAKQVRDAAIRRQAIAECRKAIVAAGKQHETEECIASMLQAQAEVITRRRADAARSKISDLAQGAYLQLVQEVESHGSTVKSHIPGLDGLIGGFFPQEMVVIAARPSVGKSALALQIAWQEARAGRGVAYFSLEMSKKANLRRMFSQCCKVNAFRATHARLTEPEIAEFSKWLTDSASAWPLWIFDESQVEPKDIRVKCQSLQSKHQEFSLIIIDYLQLMHLSDRGRRPRWEEVSEISRQVKALAMDLNVPVIALSQMVRPQKGQKKETLPTLADLRESGSIEQDADTVIFLHRTTQADASNNHMGIVDLHIAKQRNGALGKLTLTFKGDFVYFCERQKEVSPAEFYGTQHPRD